MCIRVVVLAAVLIGTSFFLLRADVKQSLSPALRAATLVKIQAMSSKAPFQHVLSQYQPFQLQLNSKHVLSRYMRHQPEYGPFQNALAVVLEETLRDEPLLLTLNPDDRTLKFHSLAAAAPQPLWIIPNGNHAVGVGKPPADGDYEEFGITEDGRLTFGGRERWGYCQIPDTRALALYWFGDDTAVIPERCVRHVQLMRGDYNFPSIEEEDQIAARRVKRRLG
jgi:hypothetical protein